MTPEERQKFRQPIVDRFEREGHPYYASARCVFRASGGASARP